MRILGSFCLFTLTLLLCLFGSFASALPIESLQADHVRLSLLLPETFGSQPTTVGVLFHPERHWHVYWKNPGDSGTAPKFSFQGNADIGEIQWPAPVRMPVAHLTNLGYEGDVAYLFDVTPKVDAIAKKELDTQVKLEWLVCKEECVPGFATLQIKRPVSGDKSVWKTKPKSAVDEFKAQVPKAESNTSVRIESAHVEGETLAVSVSGYKVQPQIYPVNGDFVGPSEPQFAESEAGKGTFLLPLIPGATIPKTASFVLATETEITEYKAIDITPGTPILNTENTTSNAPSESFLTIILLSFLGGVILNLMPCVFPVLSIKVFSVLKDQTKPGERTREALLYTLGVLATFGALGGGFLALRSAGNAIGWGFQLQSPVVVLALAILFWLMALNFLGAFEAGTSVMNVAGRANSASSFATGVLAVFVAAPCTGPFMGSALGAAAVLPAASALAIFLSLGLGLAAPFLLIALVPAVGRALPKPGAWMESFKEFLAFPLFATVLWLLWVLGQQVGTAAWQIGTFVLLGLSFGVWLSRSKKASLKAAALLIAVSAAFWGAKELRSTPLTDSPASTSNTSVWKSYDKAAIEAARTAKRGVFIDFTAAWCITCQVNKKAVLETSAAKELFKKHGVLLIRADWTNQDPKITSALAEFGRNSVPVYAFYAADGSPVKILPQILTFSMIEDLFPKP